MDTQAFDTLFSSYTDSASQGTKLYIEYESCLISYLEYIVRQNLILGKSTLISVTNVESLPTLIEALQTYKNYTLNLSQSDQIGEVDIAKLRIRANQNLSPLDPISYRQDQVSKSYLVNAAKAHYKSLYSSDFGTDKLLQLIQKQHYGNKSLSINEIEFSFQQLDLNFDVDELDHYLKLIKRAAELYNPIFDLIKSHDLISVSDDLDHETLQSHLISTYNSGKALSYQLNEKLHEYQKMQLESLNERIHRHEELKRDLDNLQEKYNLLQAGAQEKDGYSLLGITSSFKKKNILSKANQIIGVEFESWRDSFASSLPTLFSQFAQAEESTLLTNLKLADNFISSELSKLRNHKNAPTYLNVAQLNIHNCSEEIKDICSDITNYVTELNHSSIIGQPLCDNSFNILSKKEYLSTLLSSISNCIKLCKDFPEIYAWKQFMAKMTSVESKIIESSIAEIEDRSLWQATFKKYYVKRFLENQLFNSHHKSESYAVQIWNKINDQGDEVMSAIEPKQTKSLTETGEKIKSIDQNLYKALFKKKYDDSEIGIHNLSSIASIHELFPVVFVSKNQLNDQVFSGISWDTFIYIDTDKYEKDRPLPEIDTDQMIKIKHPIDQYSLDKNARLDQELYISYDTKEYITHPAIRTDEDLLRFSRSLSSKLEQYRERIKIYQIQEQFYISFLDWDNAARIKSAYSEEGIKEFLIDFDLNYSLSDIFLNDPEKISFITQDHLLDPSQYDHIEYQYYLIKLMERAGYQRKNISVEEIFLKGDRAYHIIPIRKAHVEDFKRNEVEQTFVG